MGAVSRLIAWLLVFLLLVRKLAEIDEYAAIAVASIGIAITFIWFAIVAYSRRYY
ncbi:hypothetical protein PYJP_06460 [Pyrofollis japonicus]|uniref:hypothetical protein n=1 Tax=Pyrofollis japonicus TaxID=3060460 RepID=UPI00295B0B80|nr:hypothetical protein [Pyrofollis japonicus]BEP17294.1 hypothetical protein PYJP_06460 [Pyrofollis japonicus]